MTLNRIVVLFFGFFSLSLALWAGTEWVADLWANPTRRLLQALDKPGNGEGNIDEEVWTEAISSMDAARFITPGNAQLHMWAGWLHQQQANRQPPWSPAAAQHLEMAVQAYTEALERRPSWGLVWVNRAQSRVRHGQYGALPLEDLERAVIFAPKEIHVLKQAIRLGFILWPGMNPHQRKGFLHLVETHLYLMPHTIVDLAKNHGLLDDMRPFFRADPRWRDLWEKRLGVAP